jgi:multidrug resistance protein
VPLADVFGRVTIYHAGNLGFIIFTIACAVSSNFNMLVGFRFLAGLISSAPMTVGGGTIVDILPPQKRGLGIMVWNLPLVAGPVIGPVAGGFLAQTAGWRWLFWLIAISAGAAAVIGVIVLRESNPSVLLKRKTKRLQKETGNPNLRSKMDQGLTTKDLFLRAIVRPVRLLFLSPICGLLSLYNAFVYAIIYIFFTTFTFLFPEVYHFSEGVSGLTYIGSGIGMMAGMLVYGMTSDKIIQYLTKKNGVERPKPEYRLPLTIFGSPFIPAGLFLYGWTAQYHVHWAVSLLGTLFVGFGFTIVLSSMANYLIDTFTIYAASAMAAITVSRSVFAATFPLFALHMYNALDWGWGNSLLGFIALVGCGIPPLFWFYGEGLRTNPRLQIKF